MQRLLVVWCPGSLRNRSSAARHGRSAPWWRPWGRSRRVSTPCVPGCAPCPPGARRGTSGETRVLAHMAAEAVAGVGPAGDQPGDGRAGSRGGGGRRPVRRRPGRPRPRLAGRAGDRPPGRDSLLPRPVAGGHPRSARARRPARPPGGAHPGEFAALPGPEVLARFGEDGARCQRVARGTEGELPGFRLFFPSARPGARRRRGDDDTPGGILGGLGRRRCPGGAGRGRCPGAPRSRGRGPGPAPGWAGPGPARPVRPLDRAGRAGGDPDRAAAEGRGGTPGPAGAPEGPGRGRSPHRRRPWSCAGRCPPSSPTTPAGAVGVTGGGMATAVPARLSVAGGAVGRGHRMGGALAVRRAVVVRPGPAPPGPHAGRHRPDRPPAHAGAGGWWLEATYD